MSDAAQGPNWWQASNGKGYPPESHPEYQATPNLPPPASVHMTPQQATPTLAQSPAQYVDPAPASLGGRSKPFWRRWWVIGLGALIAIVVIGAIVSPPEDDEADGVSADTTEASDSTDAAIAPSTVTEDSTAPTQPAVADPTTPPEPESTQPAVTEPTTPPPPESNLTPSQQNAVRSAESYLDFMSFSRQGLIDQLSSEYGEQFPLEDATVAVDSLNVDWLAEAVESADSYLDLSGFSRQGLIDQLSSEFGEQFTVEQATFAADNSNADWNAEAAESAQSYLDFTAFSCQGLIDQLTSEYGEQFTIEQSTYGAAQTGIC